MVAAVLNCFIALLMSSCSDLILITAVEVIETSFSKNAAAIKLPLFNGFMVKP
jgi:TRAP-type C4-dicarboxylate transport system permease small subunit